jgi:hypothetical protein
MVAIRSLRHLFVFRSEMGRDLYNERNGENPSPVKYLETLTHEVGDGVEHLSTVMLGLLLEVNDIYLSANLVPKYMLI